MSRRGFLRGLCTAALATMTRAWSPLSVPSSGERPWIRPAGQTAYLNLSKAEIYDLLADQFPGDTPLQQMLARVIPQLRSKPHGLDSSRDPR
jgi:hypothetical protein